MKTKTCISVVSIIVATFAIIGCGQTSGEGGGGQAPAAATKQAASAAAANATVARIVFIDQEQACECTQNRITASWSALQTALGPDPALPVERIHRDTQEAQADVYGALRPMVTVPGIYLLDSNGAVVELLQGEVTEEQLGRALGGGA